MLFFLIWSGVTTIAQKNAPRTNREIKHPQIRVIGIDGAQLGIMSLSQALSQAEESEVDLVEIASDATPPVCRLVDYGKLKYREAKKAQMVKQKQKVVQVKEVKFRPVTDEGDYQVKLRHLTRFLQDGDKVKVSLRFRGREITHQEFGHRLMARLKEDLSEYGQPESPFKSEGRQIIMIIAPIKKR